jgi:hypothetical protein
MAKTVASTKQQTPSVVVYGLSEAGKLRAGLFKGADVPAAKTAAGKVGLSVLDVTAETPKQLIPKLPAGRIGAKGQDIVPFVKKDLFEKIAAQAQLKDGKSDKAPTVRRKPKAWTDIQIGDSVLAQDDDPTEGWWQCVVVEKRGDLFKLRWPRSPHGKPFQRHRNTLALMHTAETTLKASASKSKSPKSYPADWSSIAPQHIVLAKEDGPCGQWWEARVADQAADALVLTWLNFPALPPIRRPRTDLGLMHPAPKTR